MLEIPVTVEGVSHNVDSVDKLLHDILLTDLEGNLFILLSCIAKELSDEDESYYYNCGDNEEPLGHPLLSNLLIGVRVAAVVVSCLIVFHSAVVVTVAEHRGCDTDVSYVEVIVSLKDLGPVVNLGVIVSVVLVFQSLNENIAVLGTSVNCEASVNLIEKDEVVALIANSLDIGDGTDLVTGVTEGEEEVTAHIVGKYLTSLLVDDGPGALGANCGVHDGGCALNRACSRGGYLYLTGGRIEAVTRHNVCAGSVELLNGSVCAGGILTGDGILLSCLVDRGGCYVDKVFVVNSDIVILCGNHFLADCIGGSDGSPESLPSGNRYLLSADISVEGALVAHYDDTLVAGCGYDEQTAVGVNCNCDRSVDGIGVEEGALGLVNCLDEVTLLIEDYQTSVICIARVDKLFVNEEAAYTGKSVGNALLVYEGIDLELILIVLVKNVDAVGAGIGKVNHSVGANGDILGGADGLVRAGHVGTHIAGINNYVGNVCIGRRENESCG